MGGFVLVVCCMEAMDRSDWQWVLAMVVTWSEAALAAVLIRPSLLDVLCRFIHHPLTTTILKYFMNPLPHTPTCRQLDPLRNIGL